MSRSSTLLIILILCACLSKVQAAESDAVDKAKLNAIKELLASTGAAANSQQFINAFSQQLISVLKIANPNISQQAIDIVNEEVSATVKEAFSNDSLQKEIYPLYAKYFSLEELNALVEFNRSDVGRKANQIMPLLMQESMNAAEIWSQKIGPQISARVLKRFNEEDIPIRLRSNPSK